MSTPSRVLINQISYTIPNSRPLFNDLSLSFGKEKTGLIGRNGVGKSTLLKLIMGELQPDSGSIEIIGNISYCAQDLHFLANQTVADVLGVKEKLEALGRIMQGSTDEQDFTILADDWCIHENIQQQLTAFHLEYLELDRLVSQLSGGERTRLLLARAFLSQPGFIIFDEPTNNLDLASRKQLYAAIEAWEGGMLIVSHDRTLLNLVHQIVELTTLGVDSYGGNFDHYTEQKAFIQAANEQQLQDAKKSLALTKLSIQASYEKREQKQSQGRNLFLTGKIDRITANSKRGRSEKTQSKNARQGESMQKSAEEQLMQAKAKMEVCYEIDVDLPRTKVAQDKIIVDIEDLQFRFNESTPPIISDFNLKIVGPERLAFSGRNGSGKTTLVKIIQGKLTPTAGKVKIGTSYVSYLDQNVETLNPEWSVLENFMSLNPTINENEARHHLAKFLFRNVAALKLVKNLSGGEKLRALLACILLSEHPPQLLILDEPTNHLDFDSIISIESALRQYQGAMIIISHDEKFLANVGVQRVIQSPFTN